MLCIKCKTELPDGAAFCHICGKKQTAGQKQRSSSSRPNGTGSVYRRGKTWECAVVRGYVVDENGKCKAVHQEGSYGIYPYITGRAHPEGPDPP